ncbi:Nudix hydrolase 3 [Striga hermonthica]|uniref:Nudix hydrolase 3 n=1 Tax=Striga hermonthica TaxID=68872 RepID=A0A9N7RMS8_STRHE|nr:Nudix hydrolase 3 [Striga hermonthica]
MSAQSVSEEHLDVLTKNGEKTGISKTRTDVHRDGDYHRAVHVWIFAESTQQLLLQKRADCKDSWAGLWDISSAGHISAGDPSLVTARRELQEELGITLPKDAFELLFVFLQECTINDGKYINNEYNDVYLVTTIDPIPLEAFTLQESEVSAVKYVSLEDYKSLLAKEDPEYVPYDVDGQYGQLFEILSKRYKQNDEKRALSLQKQLNRYARVSLDAELVGLSDGDKEALTSLVKAAKIIDEIFLLQVWYSNPSLRDWLKLHADESNLNKLKWVYYLVNKSPWESERILDESLLPNKASNNSTTDAHDLYIVPYSEEYNAFLKKASDLLHKAGDSASSSSLKKLLHSKADAFLSNEYYDSDIAWMELDSKLDVTIGPYETYEDTIFGYKATFEAFIGVKDDEATSQIKLFGDNLQVLEKNLPVDSAYKSEDVTAAPIRVIRLIYNSGDVKGPQTVAFNLPNDERIVKDRGTSMVMLKNVSEAKFELILQPIAHACIAEEQRSYVDFDSFFTHTICHECVHGIGPHTITLPDGKQSTVRLELQELHSAMEEAKADIVGLWALRFLINENLLPNTLIKSMYVSFLAGCFRSVRFGLEEAHGKGQALQFNYLFEKGAFLMHPDGTFSVDFEKVEEAVESLSREILTIQGKGDKNAAKSLLSKHGVLTQPLKSALDELQDIEVPVDILPDFPIADEILKKSIC